MDQEVPLAAVVFDAFDQPRQTFRSFGSSQSLAPFKPTCDPGITRRLLEAALRRHPPRWQERIRFYWLNRARRLIIM